MNIRERREALNISQTDLAERVGITPSAMCLYESGKRTPKVSVAFKIAKVLNCTIDELIKEQ